MLSVKPIENAGQAEHYFFEVDNYYLDNQTDVEKTTAWWGEGATQLNLHGYVDRNIFRQLLDGKLLSGQILGRFRNGERQHRAGYDLTFSAPKSVSILAEICQAKEIHTAHETAVNKTLELIQKECAQARMFKDGKNIFVDTNNITVAKIRHDVSRALDAHLHTHCLVMNATLRPEDKKWRALARQDYKVAITAETNGFLERVMTQQRYYGAVYRAHLAHQLQLQGYAIRRTQKGCIFEIVGVPKELIVNQSKRRVQIEALLQKQGRIGAHAAAEATLTTRVAKRAIDRGVLHEFWQKEAAVLGISLDEVIKTVKTATINKQQEIARTPEQAVTFAIKHLAEREACFPNTKLKEGALDYILGKAPPEAIDAVIKKLSQEGKLIAANVGANSTYWTTPEAIALEKATIQVMKDGQKIVTPILTPEKITPLLESAAIQNLLAEKVLTPGQRAAITMTLTSHDRVVGVQGDPGTGKTTMFKVVKALVEEQGYNVIGLAVSANASRQIYKETGIKSMTLSAYLVAAEKAELCQKKDSTTYPEKVLGNNKTIIIADEASMIATQDMHDLLTATAKRNVRVVTVGDVKQIDPIMAGRPFYQLQKYGMETAYMKEIIRQKDQMLRDTVACAIQKQMASAIAKLGNRIYEKPDKHACIDGLAELFLSFPQRERQQIRIGTGSREDRETLNTIIRQGLKSEGVIHSKQFDANILEPVDLTTEERCTADYYAENQVIRFGKTYASLGIVKDEYLKVVSIDKKNNIITLKNSVDKLIAWNPEKIGGRRKGVIEVFKVTERQLAVGDLMRWTRNNYKEKIFNGSLAKVIAVTKGKVTVQELIANKPTDRTQIVDTKHYRNQHWDYAYTSTIHGLQGDTCDRILVYQDAYNINLTTQKSFLVAISRARREAHVFTNDRQKYIATLVKYSGEKTTALEGELAAQKQEEKRQQKQITAIKSDKSVHKHVVANNATTRKLISKAPKPQWDANAINCMLSTRAEEIVGKLLGDPLRRSGNEWRYGTKKGSLIINMHGEKRGFWYDHQTAKGGNLLKLVQEQTGLGFKKSLEHASQLLGLSAVDKVVMPSVITKVQAKNVQPAKEQLLTLPQLKMQQYAKKLETQSLPAQGTIVERYLREHRGIKRDALPVLPESIRFHPRVWDSNTRQAYPAMLAIVKDAHGITQSVQATYLDPKTADKAQIEQQKRTYGAVRGAAVRVSASQLGKMKMGIEASGTAVAPEVLPQIALAEGVETALSVAVARPDLQVYATLGVANFANFPVSENTKRLIICADNDGKNSDTQKLVERVTNRLLDKGVEAKVIQPTREGADFNDVLKSDGIDAVRKFMEKAGVRENESANDNNRNSGGNNIFNDTRTNENIRNLAQIYDRVRDAAVRVGEHELSQRMQVMDRTSKTIVDENIKTIAPIEQNKVIANNYRNFEQTPSNDTRSIALNTPNTRINSNDNINSSGASKISTTNMDSKRAQIQSLSKYKDFEREI